jgi:hypothetical protein
MAKRERIYLRVSKGALIPADPYAESKLRARGYRMGDLLAAELTKPRNPKFNRLVHQLGQLVIANLDAFSGLDAHKAIKRLQIEGKVACDEIGIHVQGYGTVIQLIPRSLSYESMDEGEYQEAARGISRTIAERYWPDTTPEAIERMAECMIQEAA